MSLFRHIFHIASKQLFYLVVFTVAILLIAAGSAVWISDAVEQRKDEIATWASDKTGYPIEITEAGLYWLGLVPKLHITHLQVLQQNRMGSIAEVEHIYVGLDIIASLRQQQPVLRDARISGLSLGLIRDESGAIVIQGLMMPEHNNANEWQKWISILKQIDLQTISVDYIDVINQNFSGSYQLDDGIVSHHKDQWTMTGKIELPASLGQAVVFNGELSWPVGSATIESWQGQVKADNLQLQPLLSQLDWQGIAIDQGSITLALNMQGNGTHVETVNADLDVSEGKLISVNDGVIYSPVNINRLTGKIELDQQQQSWRLMGRDIQLTINEDSWPKTRFIINHNETGQLSVETDYLRLSDMTAIAVLTRDLPEMIRLQAPAGDVASLYVRYEPQQGMQTLSLTVKDFAALPWRDIPGVTGLSGNIDWRDGQAVVSLDSHQLTLYAETWLDDAVFFDSATGQLNWQQQAEGWYGQSTGLRLWNDDLTVQLDGNINHTAGNTHTDLQLKLEEVVVNKWQSYVPQRILAEEFSVWANNAFLAGKIVDGRISMKGDLSAFPFDKQPDAGKFDMLLNVEAVQLHYAPGWPDLLNVTGTITGTGNDLIIKSKQGSTAGFQFANVTTTITNLVKKGTSLTVDGVLKGTTQQALNFLQNSPLKQRFGSVAEMASATGKSDIQLNLTVPLANVDATEVTGHVSFIDSQLVSKEYPAVKLSQAIGQLQFNNNGVTAKDIKAVLLEQDVLINVVPEDGLTLVKIDGNIATDNLNNAWAASVPNYVAGQTSYQAQLEISEKAVGEFTIDASLSADLQGVSIDMPKPFNKQAEQIMPFTLSVVHADGNQLAYYAVLGDVLNIAILPVKKEWTGEIVFGKQQAKLDNHGLAIKGRLDAVSIDDWQSWQQLQVATNENVWIEHLDDIALNIDQLTGYQQRLTDLTVNAKRAKQHWQISLTSPQVTGVITLPDDIAEGSTPVILELDKLQLNFAKSVSSATKKNIEKTRLWPSIQLNAKQLQINEMLLGELQLESLRQGASWLLKSANLKSAGMIVAATGNWQQLTESEQTHFELNAHSEDLKALLASLGYQQAIEADKTDMAMSLTWPGNPLDFSRERFAGQLSLDIGKGQLIDVEPGAAGRIFGLLSVAAIPRRLSLDFSDLFGKGFSFGSIKGTFDFEEGIANTDDLIMKAETAAIEVSGPINLIEESYQQKIKITPNVSSTLPAAGAVAGGPIGLGVGTAILLFDKLADTIFDKKIINFISYSYDLTGSWDDPQLNIAKTPPN